MNKITLRYCITPTFYVQIDINYFIKLISSLTKSKWGRMTIVASIMCYLILKNTDFTFEGRHICVSGGMNKKI